MTRLTTVQKEDLRCLVAQGHRVETLADLFDVSSTTVQRVTEAPPSEEEMDLARASLRSLTDGRDSTVARFAGFSGDAAVQVSALYDCPPDSGDALTYADGTPRS